MALKLSALHGGSMYVDKGEKIDRERRFLSDG